MRIAEEKLERRIKGYIRVPKSFVYLLRDKKIPYGDFAFYYQLVCLARFDSRNPMFGVVDFTSSELSTELNLSPKTVTNHLNRLIHFGLIFKRERFYQIAQYKDLFVSPKDFTTIGNQRTRISSLFPCNRDIFGNKRNKATASINSVEGINNKNDEYICDVPLSSYKDI